MLSLTQNRRLLVWAAVITAVAWMIGYGVYLQLNREFVVIAGDEPALSPVGFEWVVLGLAVLGTFAMVFAVLRMGEGLFRDKQKSRQHID